MLYKKCVLFVEIKLQIFSQFLDIFEYLNRFHLCSPNFLCNVQLFSKICGSITKQIET